MKYVKIFLDSIESLEMLTDAERGRLFSAILRYAQSGEVPELTGNERYLWNVYRLQVDRAWEKYQEKVAATPRRKRPPVPSASDLLEHSDSDWEDE